MKSREKSCSRTSEDADASDFDNNDGWEVEDMVDQTPVDMVTVFESILPSSFRFVSFLFYLFVPRVLCCLDMLTRH